MVRITKRRRIVKQSKSRKKRMVGGGGWWKCNCDVENELKPDAAAAVNEEEGGEDVDEMDEETAAVEEDNDDASVVDADRGVIITSPIDDRRPISPSYGRSVRRAVDSVSASPPSPATVISRAGGGLSTPSSPSSLAPGEVSVLNIIDPEILRFNDKNITFKPRRDHHEEEDRRLLKHLGIVENDTLIKIGDTPLTGIRKGANNSSNLAVFKNLTKGEPGKTISFHFINPHARRKSPVDIKLKSIADIAAEAEEKARTDKAERSKRNALLRSKGGIGGGGKKKTHRRKKPVSICRRKPSRRTKKMKVMVGGTNDPPSVVPRPPTDSGDAFKRGRNSASRDTPSLRDSVARESETNSAETPTLPHDVSPHPTVKYKLGTEKKLSCTCKKERESSSAREEEEEKEANL